MSRSVSPGAELGLAFEDVEAGRGELGGSQRVDERGLVDERTARGVDEDRTGAQSGQRRLVDHVARLRESTGRGA